MKRYVDRARAKRGQIYFFQDLPALIDAPLGADQLMTYDVYGNILTDKKDTSETSNAYNFRNRLESITDPDNYTSLTYYDNADPPLVTIDGAGRKSRTVYDVLHRTEKVIRAWTGNNDGSGATLDCDLMRTNTANDPSMLQQCY